MKFDKLINTYLKVLTEAHNLEDLSHHFTILGIKQIETAGHDTFIRDEFGKTAIEVTYKYKNDEPGIFLYKGSNGVFEEWGDELEADTDERDSWEDFVNAIFVAIKNNGKKAENAEEDAEFRYPSRYDDPDREEENHKYDRGEWLSDQRYNVHSRRVPKEGDIFVSKNGRKFIRYKKADGTLSARPYVK